MAVKEASVKSLEAILLNEKRVRDFRRLFHELTGMGTAFFFEGWERGTTDYFPRRAKCDLCKLIQSCPAGMRMCMEADMQSYKLVKARREPVSFICFAGNTAIGIPIITRERFVGAVFCGDVHRRPTTAAGFARLKKTLQQAGVESDFEALRRAYMATPVVDRRTARLAEELLSLIVNYIVEREETFRLQETIYARQKEISDYAQAKLSLEKDLNQWVREVESLRRRLRHQDGGGTPLLPGTDDHALLRRTAEKVVNYINRYYMEKITLKDVADHLGMSPNYLSTLFRRQTGMGFADCLGRKRIQAACELLQDIRLNVSEVALRVGYQDTAYFNSRFKRMMGMPPGEYRKRLE